MDDTLRDAEQALVDDFSMLTDWNDRYEYLIGLGKELPAYPDALRTPELEVQGCQSQVWLHARCDAGHIYFQADSNALITKGLVAMLVNLYSGRPAQEVAGARLDFLKGIGLASHLTPSRVNGLHAMFVRMQAYATECAHEK